MPDSSNGCVAAENPAEVSASVTFWGATDGTFNLEQARAVEKL